VHSIDHLARNLRDLQDIITFLNEKDVSVHFQQEDLNFIGTENPTNKFILQMMKAFAEFERNFIHEHQEERC